MINVISWHLECQSTLALDIKSPFTFEFLGLQAKDVVEESDYLQVSTQCAFKGTNDRVLA